MESTLEKGSATSVPPATALQQLRWQRTLGDYVRLVLYGFCMGSSDVVPGVSGGTMAFILGIYEELIQSIRMVGRPQFLQPLLQLKWREASQILNWPFLMAIGSGVLLAVFTLAQGLEWLLVNHPILVWGFFFGLVLASVVVVSKRVRQWQPALWLTLAIGTVLAYWLVGLVPLQTPETWWFLLISGGIAINAMILPGISGAFILVLLGKYQFLLSAVNQRDILSLLFVMIGAAIGLVTSSQVLGWLFKRYHDLTVTALMGLMLGSLRKLWPWKENVAWIVDRHGERVPTVQHNILPELIVGGGLNLEIVFVVALALLGCGAVLLIDRWGVQNDAEKPAS